MKIFGIHALQCIKLRCGCQYYIMLQHGGIQIMKLNQATAGQVSAGHVVNLASSDAQKFDQVSILYCPIMKCIVSH